MTSQYFDTWAEQDFESWNHGHGGFLSHGGTHDLIIQVVGPLDIVRPF